MEEEDLDREYTDYLASTVEMRLDGCKLMVDCGNGAAYRLAPLLFGRLGAQVTALNAAPNGCNINLNSGALHVEGLREAVLASGADLGVAFDGDADRAIFVAASGKVVNGDAVLLACARSMKAAGRLAGDVVVATVMSNLGLEQALARAGIRMVRTPVGDKYVLEEMVRLGAMLGGEQSGHVIFREYATTGDGMLTALRLLEIARRAGAGLDELDRGPRVLSAESGQCAGAGEEAANGGAGGGAGDPAGGRGLCGHGPRAGAILRHRAAGAGHGGRAGPGAGGSFQREHRRGHPAGDGRRVAAAGTMYC